MSEYEGLFSGNVASAVGDTIVGVVSSVGDVVETIVETTGDVVNNTVDAVGGLAGKTVDTVGDVAQPLAEGVGGLVENPEALGALAGAALGVFGNEDGVVGGVLEALATLDSGEGEDVVVVEEESDNTGAYVVGGALFLGFLAVSMSNT